MEEITEETVEQRETRLSRECIKETFFRKRDIPEELQGLTEIENLQYDSLDILHTSLNILIVRHQSSNGLTFRDFNVRHSKVAQALYWLKKNNHIYANIVIDEEVLQSLPDNGPTDDQLPQLEETTDEVFDNDNKEAENIDTILFLYRFCLLIKNLQANNTPIMWPNMDVLLMNF
ncbi:unnamed protein product [Rhizophagus irregularis]|nr:unnamed protein product [Rhizophagus irregularis]CAB4446951.1 unnamed protein product [Rhizophagus irregularis]